jgi:MFS transporter, DHA1 family, inner membrane transport protein
VYRRLAVLTACTFAVGVDSFVMAGILPRLAASLRVSVATAGQLVTAYALAYAVLTPVMATLTASWPRRRVLLTGLGVFVAGNAVPTLLPWFGVVLAGRVVAGLGGAMITPVALATAAAIAPPGRQGRALSVVVAGLSAATALGAPAGTALAGVGGWRLSMAFVAGLGLVALAAVATFTPVTASPTAAATSGVVGAAGLALVGPAGLGPCGAALLVAALLVAEAAHTATRSTATPATVAR